MVRFYLLLWLKWAVRLSLCSLILACGFSLAITAIMYFNHGMPAFTDEIYRALFNLFVFWFPLMWSVALLVALFRSIKFIFNSCIAGHMLKLTACGNVSDEPEGNRFVEEIGYGDLVKVWRRWLILLIWLVGAQMIFALIFTMLFTSFSEVFEWFNIYWLFAFLLLGGYFSFVLLGSRCKRVKVVKC